ncbi:hypothetical protein TR51_10405 [Kitasatospora griseola]|uniref:Uncharacterized protein n=1 Tax=Kitasatospora griseola TaxID=2064 RepID=A0A0D0PQ35_KITGR|nr:hypothetical protein TR51_10405 [Kitasatospora griseola]
MDLIALLELDGPANVRLLTAEGLPATPSAPVVRVHAAARTPVAAESTLCGLSTRGMQPGSQHPVTSGDPWWPPRWHRHTCPICDTAVTGLADGNPHTGSPDLDTASTTADTRDDDAARAPSA